MKLTKTNLVLLGAILMMMAFPAAAQDAGGVAQRLFTQFGSFADVIMAGVFLAGLGVGAGAAFKLKAHTDNPQQVPLKQPMIYFVVAAILIGFPGYLLVSKSTFFTGNSNSLDPGTYRRIG